MTVTIFSGPTLSAEVGREELDAVYLPPVRQGDLYRAALRGPEAIGIIEQSPPDLVALDISMPEKSGVAVYRRLKEDDQLKGIPVIIVTGISDDFKKFISSRRQVPPPEGYISKPVNHEEFLKMITSLLA